MGKTNKANRTKGNTRPSSSEHSAHLLSQSGKSLSGFIGFDSLEKDVASYIPVTGQHSADADLSVDSDLRMVMRKMLKRDSITRLKAVQEFGDICSGKDKDTVKNVLPFWPRLYNKLALDFDRRIREATHLANGKLIAKVKREIAPYLKNIMGVWLLGQNDLHAPAASAAQATFIETFPKNKQSEALMYCKSEIFSLFKDNLFEQTAKSMSDPSSVSAEDIESKYTLVISATLQAMKLFLITVSSNEISNTKDDYISIISDNKFWKFAKIKEPQIRGSWYTLISFLCHVKHDMFAGMEKKLVLTVFGCLSDSDPVVAPAVWESALHIVINFDNCWQEINIHKVVIPQLWTLLNEGGRGNAHVVYPCILPFLSKFPKEVISKETFVLAYFSSLKNSLLLDSVKLSPMECDAILTTFIESLQYITFCTIDNAKEGSAVLQRILSDHVLSLIETSFYEEKHIHLVTSKLYSLLSSLIQKIESKCLNDEDDASNAFSQVLISFWNTMYNIFCKVFDKKEEEKKKISINIAYFFHSIFTPSSVVKKEKSKVRFEDEVSDECLPSVSKCFSSKDMHKKMPLTFKNIIKFIKILCLKIDESINLCYFKILDEILASTLNENFIIDILEAESYDPSEKAGLTFFNKVIFKWVNVGKLDATSIAYISDIVFSLCSAVSEHEALEILEICCEKKNPVFLEKVLIKGLGDFAHEPVIQKWLKSPELAESIVNGWEKIMELVMNEESIIDKSVILAHKNILLMTIVNKDFQESLKEKNNFEKILVLCKDFIEKGINSKKIDHILELSCNVIETILSNFQDCWKCKAIDDLLSVLFLYKLNSGDYELSEKALSHISQVWHSAIFSSYKNGVITRKDNFLAIAAKELRSSLCCLLNSKRATSISNEILNLLYTIKEVESSFPSNYTSAFVLSYLLENILPSDLDWEKLRENLVFSPIPAVLERKIMYFIPTENYKVAEKDVYKLFLATQAVFSIFRSEIEKNTSGEDEQYFEQSVIKHLPSLTWCLSYCTRDGFITQEFDKEFKVHTSALDEVFLTILKFISYEKLKDVLKDMFYCSLSTGLYWALPLQFLIEKTKILYPESVALFDELIFEANLMESDYVSLTVQILSHHISKEKKVYYMKRLIVDMLDKPHEVINEEYGTKLSEICCIIRDSDAIDEEVQILLTGLVKTIPTYKDIACLPDIFRFGFISLISSVAEFAPGALSKTAWIFLQTFLTPVVLEEKSKPYDKPEDLCYLFHISMAYFTSHSFAYNNRGSEMLWKPDVSNDTNEVFVYCFINIWGVIKKFHSLPKAFELTLINLLKSVEYIPEKHIWDIMALPAYTEEVSSPLDSLTSILLSDIPHIQLAAHISLMKLIPFLAKSLSEETKCDTEDEEEKIPSKFSPLVHTLNVLNELMEGMLWDIKIGECCVVMPNTEPFTFVCAYLFAWLEMLEFISASPSQLRSGYVAHLEETKLLSSLFSNVYRLMPENPLSCLKKGSCSESPKKENLTSLFLHPPKVFTGEPSSEEIQVFACHTFCEAMRKVPASVRIWWNNLDNKSADIVNKFTSKYISGILCSEEIRAVHENEKLFKNMVVKARLGTREVIATYTVDDFAIELYVQLPANYPLGPITAEKRGKIIIPHQEWRHWLMQLTTVLNFQNGSILDGLNIWKKNLDKKFEGVEECVICYYILHSTSMKLPRLSCHTCRKKFHSACLYKWFHSINNTKCPLCRNEFTI